MNERRLHRVVLGLPDGQREGIELRLEVEAIVDLSKVHRREDGVEQSATARKVEVGDRIDGGRVLAIGESTLRYQKDGRNVTLGMPSG